MSFKPLHNLDDGIVTRNSFVPISDGTDVQKCTTQQLISTALGTGSDLEFNASNLLSIKSGAIDSSKIANGAITGDKIQNGGVDLSKIKTEGESSLPVNILKRKTICLHVGNYYRNNTPYKANDSINFNTSINRYEGRTESVVSSIDDESMNDVWLDLHTDTTEVHIIEPFATLSAAARFAQYNYGPNLNAVFLIHGHVAAVGSYDLDINKRISQVIRWTAFDNIAIIAGSSPKNTDPDSHYANYFSSSAIGALAARIDWDQDTKHAARPRERTIAFDFSGVNLSIAGINFVFNSTFNFSSVQNIFSGGKHYVSGVRMASLGDIDDFTPYYINSNAKAVFGDPDVPSSANEFSFKEDGTLFKLKDNSSIRYAKNSDNTDILINTYKTNANIRFCHLIESSTFDMGDKNTEIYFETSSNVNTNITPVILQNGQNRFLTDMQSQYYMGGGPGGLGTYADFIDTDYDLLYQSGSSMSDSSNRKNYSDIKTHPTSIYKRATSIANTSYRERIISDTEFIYAPSTRTANPYSDQ